MPARQVTFELSEEQARWIDERVGSGAYSNAHAAVEAALDDRILDEVLSRAAIHTESKDGDRAALANDQEGDVDLDAFFDAMIERLELEPGR